MTGGETLAEWASHGWLRAQAPDASVVVQLQGIVRRELMDSEASGLSTDGAFTHLYQAGLTLGTLALHAAGYRVRRGESQHERTIESLAHTLGADADAERRLLRVARKRRHLLEYELAGGVSRAEVEALRQGVLRLKDRAEAVLKERGLWRDQAP